MKQTKLLLLAVGLILPGCDGSATTDYLEIAGGGISYNYRYAQATVVVVVKQIKTLPQGATVVAKFGLPGGASLEKIVSPAVAGKLFYKMESNPMQGIRKGEPLKVSVELHDAKGLLLDQDETQYTSDVNQADLSPRP